MMLYCCDCGSYFDISEAHECRDYVGEFWGVPAYETYSVCPYCESESLIDENDEDFPTDGAESEEIAKAHRHDLLKGMYLAQQMRRNK